MYDDDNPLGLTYDAPITLQDQLGAARSMLQNVMGTIRYVPKFLENLREQVRQEAQAPLQTKIPTSTDKVNPFAGAFQSVTGLAEGYMKTEAQVQDAITSGLERIGIPTGLAIIPGVLIGGVITDPSPAGEMRLFNKAGQVALRRTKVGAQFPEVAADASKYMDEAEAYLKKHGSLEGYPRFIDPLGEEYLVRPRGTKADGTTRLAMSPMSVKQAYTNVRKGRDVTSSSFEKFQRQLFDQMVRENKQDLMMQFAEMPSYVEHNRRLSSPFWNSARAKNQKAGDVDNLSLLFDLDFKKFKDNVDRALDRITDSPIDAYYDPLVDSIVVENVKTGKQLGYLDQTLDIKTQLNNFISKIK